MWVILWSNGTVMTFSRRGHQVVGLQGPAAPELLNRLEARQDDVAQWTLADWRQGVQAHLTAREWLLFARLTATVEAQEAQGTSG